MLPTIEAPTLVIRGERDTARTRDHVTELVAGLRDARAVELAGLGHSPMIEDPDLVASLVGSHLRGSAVTDHTPYRAQTPQGAGGFHSLRRLAT